MPALQLILTLLFYAWLFVVLFLLWRIWRDSMRHIHRMESTLFEAAQQSAKAAIEAAEAARKAVEGRKG